MILKNLNQNHCQEQFNVKKNINSSNWQLLLSIEKGQTGNINIITLHTSKQTQKHVLFLGNGFNWSWLNSVNVISFNDVYFILVLHFDQTTTNGNETRAQIRFACKYICFNNEFTHEINVNTQCVDRLVHHCHCKRKTSSLESSKWNLLGKIQLEKLLKQLYTSIQWSQGHSKATTVFIWYYSTP